MEGSLSHWMGSVTHVILVAAEYKSQHNDEAEPKDWQRIVVSTLIY